MEQLVALLRKDVLIISRRWHELASLIIISIVIGIGVAYMISGPLAPLAERLDASVVVATGQIIVYFIVSIATGFIAVLREAEKGTLDGLRASPLSPEILFVAKLIYIYIIIVILSFAYSLATIFFSGYTSIFNTSYVVLSLSISLYFASATALTSFMIIYSEARSLLSMVVLSGLLAPFLQEADRTLAAAAAGTATGGQAAQILGAALAFAVIATILSKPLSEI